MRAQDGAAPQFLEQNGGIGKGTPRAPQRLRNQDAQPAQFGRLAEEFGRYAGGRLFQRNQRVFIVLLAYKIGRRRLQ